MILWTIHRDILLKENLSNRLYYDEIAVEYHKKEGNLCQIEYFENNVAMARKILGR